MLCSRDADSRFLLRITRLDGLPDVDVPDTLAQ